MFWYIKFYSNMWIFFNSMVCTSKKLFPSLVEKRKYLQKLFFFNSPRHPLASHPEKEKNNYFKFFLQIIMGQTQNVEVWIRTNNAFDATCITDWILGCKMLLGCCEDLWKAEESNKIWWQLLQKEIKNTSQIRWFQVGQFQKLDLEDKRLHRSNPSSQRTSTFGWKI